MMKGHDLDTETNRVAGMYQNKNVAPKQKREFERERVEWQHAKKEPSPLPLA